MENKIKKLLNFTDKETAIYLALLELGTAKANDIAKKTEINRTTVYDIADSLLKRGLISKYKKGASTYFSAKSPKDLLNYLESEKNEKIKQIDKQKKAIEELLPQLITIQNKQTQKPKVQFYEGEKGMREAYEDTLNAKGILYGYANIEKLHKTLPNFFPEYYKRRAAKKIFGKGFLVNNKYAQERIKHNVKEMRDVKLLPEGLDFSPEINLYNDKMLMVSWKEKMAVIIESKELVDLQKIVFELLWENLPRE